MVLVDKTLEEMLENLGGGDIVRKDSVVPKDYGKKDIPKQFEALFHSPYQMNDGELVRRSHRPSDLRWLTAYSSELFTWFNEQGYYLQIERIIDAFPTPFNQAMGSFFYSNKDDSIPIDVEIYECKKGIVFNIQSKSQFDLIDGFIFNYFEQVPDEISVIPDNKGGSNVVIGMSYEHSIRLRKSFETILNMSVFPIGYQKKS